jgi:glutamine amidotransferase
MCLLIVKPAGVAIARGLLTRATRAHPDGFGVAWASHTGCHATKGVQVSVDAQASLLAAIVDAPAIVHWRWATHGSVSIDNAHPFALPNGGWAAHNGVLRGFGAHDRSDTRDFVDTVLSCYLGPAEIESDRAFLDPIIRGSKIATIHPDGTIVRLGDGWIRSQSGLLASNESGFARRDRGSLRRDRRSGACDLCGDAKARYRVTIDGGSWSLCRSCRDWSDRNADRVD